MRFFLLLILSTYIAGCAPRLVENPAAEAQTYTEEEFTQESGRVLLAEEAKKDGLSLEITLASIINKDLDYEVRFSEKITSENQTQIYQRVIQREVDRIDAFLNKYQGVFRIRYKDGDLKVMTLRTAFYEKIDRIKKAWLEAQKRISAQALALPPTDI